MSHPKKKPSLGGVVLCGGHSRRMGTDKAWLPLAGQTLLLRTVSRLTEVADPIVVVRAAHQKLRPLPQQVRVASDLEPDQGPLRAFQAGLAAVGGDCDLVFLIGCDAPLLRPQFVQLLRSHVDEHQAVVVRDDKRFHPLGAIYRSDIETVVARLLHKGKRRLQDLVASLDCRVLRPKDLATADPKLDSLRCVNTPDEYQRLLDEANRT